MYGQRINKAQGFILVTAMLFLLVLSLLAFSKLEIGFLEQRMGIFYQNKVTAFYLAEDYLLRAEEQILAEQEPLNVEVDMVNYHECQEVVLYRLTVRASYRGAKSVLRSIVAKVGDVTHCNLTAKITSGRQAFWDEDIA